MEQSAGHPDDLGLQLADAREDVGVQGIGQRGQAVDLLDEPRKLGIGVAVHAARDSAVFPVVIACVEWWLC